MELKKKKSINILELSVIIILLIICIITSFKSGQKYYDLKNTQFKDTNSKINADIANWRFRVTIVY